MTSIVYSSPEQEKAVEYICKKIFERNGEPKLWVDGEGRLCVDIANGDASVKSNPFVVSDKGAVSMLHPLAPAPTVHRETPKTPSKNTPCPCGSGQKYRKCHGKKEK